MRERIEFTTKGTIEGRKEIAKINEYVNNFNFDCEFERKLEQVPETFEELKELCEKIKVIDAYTEYISCHNFLFWKNGVISSETDDGEEVVYISDRTPQQMWEIIKNLIG